jgi:hypothetical protein
MVMEQVVTALISGAAIAIIGYDTVARLGYQKQLSDTLIKLNTAHNALSQQFQALSEQVSHLEMSVGLKAKAPHSR